MDSKLKPMATTCVLRIPVANVRKNIRFIKITDLKLILFNSEERNYGDSDTGAPTFAPIANPTLQPSHASFLFVDGDRPWLDTKKFELAPNSDQVGVLARGSGPNCGSTPLAGFKFSNQNGGPVILLFCLLLFCFLNIFI